MGQSLIGDFTGHICVRRALGSNLNIQFFGYPLDRLLELPINLQALLESRDRRVDGRIFEATGKFAHLFEP